MEQHSPKSITKPSMTHIGQLTHRRWRLLLLVCILLVGLPLSLVQATPEQLNQPGATLAQTDPTTTTYLPLISTGETDTPPPPDDSQAPRFEPGACPIAPPSGVEVTCGYLSVPESRQQPTDQRIQLAVMIVHAMGDNPVPDPVVFLQGGPGGAAIELTNLLVQGYAPILEQRDLVVIDQRGTGFSRPFLSCPYPSLATEEQTVAERLGLTDTLQQDDPIRDAVALITECYTTLTQAGVDPSAYTSAENAADLADLQEALDYPAINLLGGSYGTRLALTAMRDHPDAIRSVVLDSVYPLQVNFHIDTYASFDQALQGLFDGCAADTACNTAYPDLEMVFGTVVEQLNTTPADVPITDPVTGQETTIPFTGDALTNLIFNLLYGTTIIPVLPQLITDISQGDYELLSIILSNFGGGVSSLGMLTAVQCSEDLPFATVEDFVTNREAHPRAQSLVQQLPFNEAFLEICDAWALPAPDPIENEAVESDIDALIITGEYDPITPPQWGDLAAETLENSFVVPPYPRGGHVPSLVSPCVASIVAAFLDTPAEEPDVSCIEEEAPLPFVVDQDEARSVVEDVDLSQLP